MRGKKSSLATATSTHIFATLLSARQVLECAARRLEPSPFGVRRASFENTLIDWMRQFLNHSLGDIPAHQLQGALNHDLNRFPADPVSGRRPPLLLQALDALAVRFMEWEGGIIHLNYERLLNFQFVNTQIMSEQLSSYLMAVHNSDEPFSFSPRYLSPSRLGQLFHGPLYPPVNDPFVRELLQRGLSECHRHLNGSMLPIMAWAELVENPAKIDQWEKREKGTKNRYQWIAAATPWEAEQHISQTAHIFRTVIHLRSLLLKSLVETSSGKQPFVTERHKEQLTNTLTDLGSLTYKPRHTINARRQLQKNARLRVVALPGADGSPLTNERAFVFHLLQKTAELWRAPHQDDHELFFCAAHCYLVGQNRLLAELFQPRSGQAGLERFVSGYSANSIRDQFEENNPKNIADRMVQAYRTGGVHWLEVRITPSGSPYAKVRNLVNALRERLNYCEGLTTGGIRQACFRHASKNPDITLPNAKANLPDLGIVFHFIKRPDQRKPSSRFPQRTFTQLRKLVWAEAFQIAKVLDDEQLGRWVVGLDIAGNELDAPVDVFAPAIRWLQFAAREEIKGLNYLARTRSHSLRLTAHCGEEFRHLLSGMRSVHETIGFLKMGAGDRIGHGLALGLDPQCWQEETGGSVFLSRGEWLDNLVWLFGLLQQMPTLPFSKTDLLMRIEQEAMHIYSDNEVRPSAVLLLQADKWRALDPAWHWRGDQLLAFPLRIRAFLEDESRRLAQRLPKEAAELHKQNLADARVLLKRDEIIEVPVDPAWSEPMRHLQNGLLDLLAKKKIAIEVNPSSNTSISSIESVMEHPIFRWKPPEDGNQSSSDLAIVIGSDDPGIFSTELIHEYALLMRAAEERGVSIRHMQQWSKDLRDMSLTFSFLTPNYAP